MLPSVLAGQLQEGLEDYIRTTFPMTNPVFKGSLDRMLAEKDSLYHEPYTAVRLPFRVAETPPDLFESVHMSYAPYVHQQKAFERLTGNDGRSTLIATGTGSGKTECFLYPILEYCYRRRGEKGIKALIIYPMNALASDQAKRLAELIYNSPELKGNVTAGMYVGGFEESPSRMMSADKIITDHGTMLSSPPDILLSNYKMLDYLLVRPRDAGLWKDNHPETLKYITVDELHTFDGAQGTDLACLLRRLKARLYTPPGYVCCIGTSATMGARESADTIREYAKNVFGEIFENDAVITEDRLTAAEFFDGYEAADFTVPDRQQTDELLTCKADDSLKGYLTAAAGCWFDQSFAFHDIMSDETRLDIGKRLMTHSFMQNMLICMGGNYIRSSLLFTELKVKYPQLTELSCPEAAIDALFALISHARSGTPEKLRPFLYVHVQLWIRELRRLLAKVTDGEITYATSLELNENQVRQYLPVVNCRDCGETGWLSLLSPRGNLTMTNLEALYKLYFTVDSKIRMLFPHGHEEVPGGMAEARICPACLQFETGDSTGNQCSACGTDTFPVLFPVNNIAGRGDHKTFFCPFCGSMAGLSIMGLRCTTEISAEISQLFSSTFNDDKKLLAFSDNVQDASHRAGFFSARSWKSGLRTALQQFTKTAGDGMSMADYEKAFIDFLHGKYCSEEFVGYFIAPNMTWKKAYEKMTETDKLGSDIASKTLIKNTEQRLKYEIMLEFGMCSRIGRTLEKSGCSVLCFDGDLLKTVAGNIKTRVLNELNELCDADDAVFYHMAAGFLHIMKSNGAFSDSVFYKFVNDEGKAYMLSNSQIKWMPGVYEGRNVPRFIAEPNSTGKRLTAFDSLYGNSKYIRWIDSCIGELMVREDVFESVVKIIFEELIKLKIIVQIPSPTLYKVWALDKKRVKVSMSVKQFVCGLCGTALSVSEENAEFWTGAPCQRARCPGRVYADDAVLLGYYGKLYGSGNMFRIVAKEHTGLLDRDHREKLERTFKRGSGERMPWDTNLLSCTPTLEMGIDIGDLSTVVLCSIPPAQTHYLQRVGRAGRKDGNALTIAVANTRPHDLYFYTDPMEMIAGIIEPPKIFLQASAVLERQFVAYCMDCWVRHGVPEKALPKYINVCLARLNEKNNSLFPFNFLQFVQNNLSSLLRTFIQLFSKDLDENSTDELRIFAQGDKLTVSPMYLKIYEAFETLKIQLDVLNNTIRQLQVLIKEIEKKPKDTSYDKEIKELKNERTAMLNVVKSLNQKDILNFLSDEGLLPNYAFPEAGIVLKAILYRNEESADDDEQDETAVKKHKYEKMVYEYNRSASSAISEFAPSNNFYAEGRKLCIDQIDLTTATPDPWRLCPNCSHAQIQITGADTASCPQCGSPSWADAGQVRTMLKVQMVYSNMDYTKSLIGDESDDRSTIFYNKQMLVDVDEEKNIIKAFRMDNQDFPFGYEFVRKAVMREINFGEKDLFGETMTVAGKEDICKGFKICRYCGKIQPEHGEPKHTYLCRAKKSLSTETNNTPYEECLFLYREFSTEALRILIPATTMDSSNVRQESFIAAFMLGMKKYFGNVDHLRACISEVPVPDADYRKQYLVIYDSVPGGTGYLKQLMHKENALTDIFEAALTVLENCECRNDIQKDGCYHCLYAYRQSKNIGEISRSTAVRILKQILSGKENIEEIPKLNNVPVNSLFESELERRFVEAFAQMSNKSRKIETRNELVHSKPGYLIKIGECSWEVEPQVLLDAFYGVPVSSRADFVLWPVRVSEGQKPVAIFTDGFQYHKEKIADDTLKREAIRRSGRFRVWTLSWKDVQNVFKTQGEYAAQTLVFDKMPSSQIYKPSVNSGGAQALQPDKMQAFELLVQYLQNRNAETLFAVHTKAYSLSLLNARQMNKKLFFDEWNGRISPVIGAMALHDTVFALSDTVFGTWMPENGRIAVFAGIRTSELQTQKGEALPTVCAVFDEEKENSDRFEADWNGFWHFVNIMQFSRNFYAVSSAGIKQMIYQAIPVKTDAVLSAAVLPENTDAQWADILKLVLDDSVKECSRRMIECKISAPSAVGFELTDKNGAVAAECELVWENKKAALLLPEQMEYKDIFETNGWTVITLENACSLDILKGGIDQ